MLFRRKLPPLEALPPEDQWSLSRGVNAGRPLVVRANASAKSYAAHPEMPIRLGMAVPLKQPDDHGLPTGEESAQLDTIEDLVFEAVNGAGRGRVVLVITTSGMREFVSYVRSAEHGESAVSQVRAAVSDHEVQYYVADDPRWDVYRQFA